MRETDYVELAFWAGWCQAQGVSLGHDDLCDMAEAMKGVAAHAAEQYLESLGDEVTNAGD